MLNPVRIYGAWDEGIVLDKHIIKSIFLGCDEKGKEKFENTRTEIGEVIYKFKYQKDKDCLFKIMNLIKDILDKWKLKEKIDVVIPAPPSNKVREYQHKASHGRSYPIVFKRGFSGQLYRYG